MNSHLDLTVVGIYLVFLVLVGLTFSRLVKNSSDYFRAGGQSTWWMVGASMFMSSISAYTFVGNAAGIYKSGLTPLSIYVANVFGFLIAALFLAAWYRQMRAVTYAEIIRERFGKSAEQLVTHLLVINGFTWSGVGLYTLAVFLSPLVPDLPVPAIIFIIGIVVVIYCTVGGSWASIANDFVQGLVLISITSTITVLCFHHAGGVGAFIQAVRESPAAGDLALVKTPPPGTSDWTMNYGITWMALTFAFQFANQSSLFQGVRYFAAKNGREARMASVLACVLMCVGLLVFFVPPIFARVFLETQVHASHPVAEKAVEYAYSVASREVLPKGTFCLMIVAVFAAAISTLDTGLNRNAGLIVRDLLPAYRKLLGLPPLAAGRELSLGKIATVLAGFMVMGFATIYTKIEQASIFDIMQRIIAQLIAPQIIPLLLFLFVRKVPRWSIYSSLAGGYLPSLVTWILQMTHGIRFSYQQTGAMVLVGSVTGFLVARMFWNRVSDEERRQTAAFYERMERPIDFETEVGEGSDVFQFKMIGRFAVLLGLLFLLLLIPVDSDSGRTVILVIAGFVAGIGALMLWRGKVLEKQHSTTKKPA